jgi:hypothetical protein
MKNVSLILFIAVSATLAAFLGSFITALRYDYLFTGILVLDVVAIACFISLVRLGMGLKIFVFGLGILVFYSAADVTLRWTLGVRVLDIFQ